MSKADEMLDQLEQYRLLSEGDSPAAIHLRDQLREGVHQAFMKTIAPDFQQPDGSYPDWIARGHTKIGKPWTEEDPDGQGK